MQLKTCSKIKIVYSFVVTAHNRGFIMNRTRPPPGETPTQPLTTQRVDKFGVLSRLAKGLLPKETAPGL